METLVNRCLSATVGKDKDKGVYHGEWLKGRSQFNIEGRGIIECGDKFILGYIKDGQWVRGSN